MTAKQSPIHKAQPPGQAQLKVVEPVSRGAPDGQMAAVELPAGSWSSAVATSWPVQAAWLSDPRLAAAQQHAAAARIGQTQGNQHLQTAVVVLRERSALRDVQSASMRPCASRTIQRQETAGDVCTRGASAALSIEELEGCVQEVYQRSEGITPELNSLVTRYTQRLHTEWESLSDDELLSKVQEAFSRYLRSTPLSPEFFVAQIRLKVATAAASGRPFPATEVSEVLTRVRRRPRSLRGGLSCLDVAYLFLETVYPDVDFNAIADRIGFPRIARGARTKARAPAKGGLLTATMNELMSGGRIGEVIALEYPRRMRNRPQLAVPWLARKLLDELTQRIPERDGAYCFMLSLHVDYHSVALVFNRKDNGGTATLTWIDQYGPTDVSTQRRLQQQIDCYGWPDYAPGYSTVWRLKRPALE